LIEIVSNFTGSGIKKTSIETLTDNDRARLIQKSPTGTFPVLKDGMTMLSNTIAITKHLLWSNKDTETILLGDNPNKKSRTEMWINFITSNLLPIIEEIKNQKEFKEANAEILKTATADLETELKKINQYLTFKSFLVDYQVSLADIVLAVALHPIFTSELGSQLRDSVPNVHRVFEFVLSLDEVSSVYEQTAKSKN
jgi:glutathione S-transferase